MKLPQLKTTLNSSRNLAVRYVSDSLSLMTSRLGVEPLLMGSVYAAVDQWFLSASRAGLPNQGERIAVYALRNAFWAEWATYCCCRLITMGYEPILFYSGSELRQFFGEHWLSDWELRAFWDKVKSNTLFKVIDLEAARPPQEHAGSNAADVPLIRAKIWLAYDSHDKPVDDTGLGLAMGEISRTRRLTRQFIDTYAPGRCVLPSGLIGTSSGVFLAMRDHDIPVVTLERWGIKPFHMVWNLNAAAVHCDYGGWFATIDKLNDEQEQAVRSYIQFQDDPHGDRAGLWKKYRAAQSASAAQELPASLQSFLGQGRPTALLGTNVIGDSATLGKATLFGDQKEWIREVVHYFEEQDDCQLVIRVHPEEHMYRRFPKIGEFIKETISRPDRVYLIDSSVPVNTFAVAAYARVGLIWVTNLGVDLVARGTPAIAGANAPYKGLGIAEEPRTKEEFFLRLGQLLARKSPVERERQAAAYKYIYILTRLRAVPGGTATSQTRRLRLHQCPEERELLFSIITGSAGRTRAALLDYHWQRG